MNELCQNLASTGANAALYVAVAFGLISLAAIGLYYLKNGKKLHGGLFSLLILVGLLGSLVMMPLGTAHAAGAATNECIPASQASSVTPTPTPTPIPTPSLTCAAGWVVVPGNAKFNTTDFCVMKYSAKNAGGTVTNSDDINGDGSFMSETYSGGVAASTPTAQPWANISQTDAITASQTAGAGAHLITDNEWMTIAHNVLTQPANWCDTDGSNCGNAPGTAGKILANGHNDGAPNQPLDASLDDTQACFGTVTAGVNSACGSDPSTQKRTLTLSNGAVIWDLAGNVYQWTAGTETKGNLPSNGGSGNGGEYNTDFDDWGTLSYINPADPTAGNPAAGAWNSSQGLGVLDSDFSSGSSGLVGFGRGGAWDNGGGAGAFALGLYGPPSATDPILGFRAAR